MLKNIHPSQISFNKARRYYLHLERFGHMHVNKLSLKKTYEVQLTNIIDELPMNYNFTFNYNKEHGCRIRFIPYIGQYMLLYFICEDNGNLDSFLTQVMLYGSRNVILTMCENYKLITMLIYNKYNKNDKKCESNKVLSNKDLMRFIASYL